MSGRVSYFCSLIRLIRQNTRFYDNPLIADDKDDLYVLHFYDLPAKKPFTMYYFVKEN
jgi:hypothetical protein